jgi:hypothetical protein
MDVIFIGTKLRTVLFCPNGGLNFVSKLEKKKYVIEGTQKGGAVKVTKINYFSFLSSCRNIFVFQCWGLNPGPHT